MMINSTYQPVHTMKISSKAASLLTLFVAQMAFASVVKADGFSNVDPSTLGTMQSNVDAAKQRTLNIKSNASTLVKLNTRMKAVDGQSSIAGDNSGYAGTTLADQISALNNKAVETNSSANTAQSSATNALNGANRLGNAQW